MEKSWRSPYATRRYIWPVLAVATVFVAILVWFIQSPAPRVNLIQSHQDHPGFTAASMRGSP